MQVLPKTNPSETKVTNTGVSKPPQIGGCTVSRSSGLENNFFLLPKPFSENLRTADSKNVRFLRFQPFLAEKMALEVKKARFNPFVLPSDFFKADGDPVYTYVVISRVGERVESALSALALSGSYWISPCLSLALYGSL